MLSLPRGRKKVEFTHHRKQTFFFTTFDVNASNDDVLMMYYPEAIVIQLTLGETQHCVQHYVDFVRHYRSITIPAFRSNCRYSVM